MARLCGRPFVYANPQERFLSDTATVNVALKELSRVLHYSERIVCNLSSSGLTLELAKEVPQPFKQLTKLYAVDLSSNFIRLAKWQDVFDLVNSFLRDDAVQYLDLGLNYPPC